jgi:hypothetical protein
MEWTFKIGAEARPRVLMRIAQLFEQQMVAMRTCHMVTIDGLLDIVITVDLEAELAHRIHAKLWKQFDLLRVDLFAGVPRHCEDMADAPINRTNPQPLPQ